MADESVRAFRNYILPLASIFETIATSQASKGRHVGTSGIEAIKGLDEQRRIEEEQRQKAIERAATGEIRELQKQKAEIGIAKAKKEQEQEAALETAVKGLSQPFTEIESAQVASGKFGDVLKGRQPGTIDDLLKRHRLEEIIAQSKKTPEQKAQEKAQEKSTIVTAQEEAKKPFIRDLAQFKEEAKIRAEERARARRLNEQKIKHEQEQQKMVNAIPGLVPVPDTELTSDSVKKAKKAYSSFKIINKLTSRMRELFQKHGAEIIPGEVKGSMASINKDIQLELKELVNLGVLNGPDMIILEGQIPDPTKVSSAATELFTGIVGTGSQIGAKFETFQQNLIDKINLKLDTHGFQIPKETAQEKTIIPQSEQDIDNMTPEQLKAFIGQ